MLALSGAVMAQQPTPKQSQQPLKKTDEKASTEVKSGARTSKPETPLTKEPAVSQAPKRKVRAKKEGLVKEGLMAALSNVPSR